MKCPFCGSNKLEETANFNEFSCKLCNCEFRDEKPGYTTFEEGKYENFCENVADCVLQEASGGITHVINAIAKEASQAGIEYIDIPIERLQDLYESVKNESSLGIIDSFDLKYIKEGMDKFIVLGENILKRTDLEINMERFSYLKENQLSTISVKPLGPVGGGKRKEVIAGAVEEEITPEVNIVDDETIEAIADDSLDELKSMYSDSPEGTFDFEIQYIIEVAKKYWPEIETYSPETLDKIKTVLDQKANAGSSQDFTENEGDIDTSNMHNWVSIIGDVAMEVEDKIRNPDHQMTADEARGLIRQEAIKMGVSENKVDEQFIDRVIKYIKSRSYEEFGPGELDWLDDRSIKETPNYSGDTDLSHLSSVGSDEDPNSPEAQGIEDDSEFYDDKIGGVSDFASDIKEPKNPIDIDSAITIIKSEGLQDDLEIYKRLLELVGNISGEEADKVLDTVRGISVGVREDSLTGTGIGDGTNDIGANPDELDIDESNLMEAVEHIVSKATKVEELRDL